MGPLIGFNDKLKVHPDLEELLNYFTYAWLEGLSGARLSYLADEPKWNQLATWPEGRIFGLKGEYRWQKNPNNTIHAVLILEEGALPQEFQKGIDMTFVDNPKLILWGRWVDPNEDPGSNPDGGPRFYAPDLPRVQIYPIPRNEARIKGKMPCLVTRRYHHELEGNFVRCLCLSMIEEDKEVI